MKIELVKITELKKRTGMGIMDVKDALEETYGNEEDAYQLLRLKGAKNSIKRNEEKNGIVYYVHFTSIDKMASGIKGFNSITTDVEAIKLIKINVSFDVIITSAYTI